jgi:NAD(P)-dependent dehydrogenase (short-subunit alcohol dehydrogenase family)
MVNERVALVTGGNRGIGFEACRQLAAAGLRVILTARNRDAGMQAAETLRAEGRDVAFEQLDVADPASVRGCAGRVTSVDVLINNAGVLLDRDARFLDLDESVLDENMQVHFFGAARTCRAWVPGMVDRGYGRVVNLVSGWGSWSGRVPGPAGYALGKAALRALTRKVASEVRGDVKVNALDPGWVATDMGGAGASRSARQAADTVVWLATLPASGPNDACFSDRRRVDW